MSIDGCPHGPKTDEPCQQCDRAQRRNAELEADAASKLAALTGQLPSDQPKSLGTALPAEMARVRDEVLPRYLAIGVPGQFAAMMLRQDLDAAAKALAEGDVVAMLRAYEALRGAE